MHVHHCVVVRCRIAHRCLFNRLGPRSVSRVAMVKRVAHNARDEKRHKASLEFAKLVSAENQAEFGDDLCVIITELLANTGKIKNCKRAVLGDSFDPDMLEKIGETFAPSVVYISKIPKEFLKQWLPSISGLTLDRLKKYEKAHIGTLNRIACRQCQCDLASPNAWRDKIQFEKNMNIRSKKVGKVEYVANDAGAIDWSTSGWFALSPPFAGGTGERATHVYTHATFLPLGIKVAEGDLLVLWGSATPILVGCLAALGMASRARHAGGRRIRRGECEREGKRGSESVACLMPPG